MSVIRQWFSTRGNILQVILGMSEDIFDDHDQRGRSRYFTKHLTMDKTGSYNTLIHSKCQEFRGGGNLEERYYTSVSFFFFSH